MKRILIIIAFALNMLPMVTDYNWGTATAQTLDNEYGYECEEPDGFRYISPIPCDAVEICREQCPLCGEFADCDVMWMHTCYTPDSELGEGSDSEDNQEYGDNGSYPGGYYGGNSSHSGGSHGTSYVNLQKQALDLIQFYKSVSQNNRFYSSEIYKNAYLEKLENVIRHPQTIYQGANGTCGAAVLMKMLAEIAPSDLVKAAISLFETGEYRPWSWTIPEGMKNCTLKQLKEIRINEVEAIVQTGITNGNNKYMEYSANTDNQNNKDFWGQNYEGTKSFMWPSYIRDFTNSIYPNKFIEMCSDPDFPQIRRIDYAQEFVIAAVDTNDTTLVHDGLLPTHYVQIKSVRESTSEIGCYDIEYWDYGRAKTSHNYTTTGIYYLYRIRR